MTTIGRHLIVEFYDCDRAVLDDVARIRAMALAATREVKATIMGEIFQRYEPQGVSGVVLIAESHLSIHTWPESAYVAADIFTCGGLDPRPGVAFLGRELRAASSRVQEILRGIPGDIAQQRALMPSDVVVISELGDARELRAPTA